MAYPLLDNASVSERFFTLRPFIESVTQPDITSPTIGNITPAPGTPINPQLSIAFDVTDPDDGFSADVVMVKFAALAVWEVVHDGTSFAPNYAGQSTRAVITHGYHYVVFRNGGWPDSPTFLPVVVDTHGNVNA